MKDTNDLVDLDVISEVEMQGNQGTTPKAVYDEGQKPETPIWIRLCENNDGCSMAKEVASSAKKLFEENERLKDIQKKYEHLRTVALEGRQILLNEVYIDFDFGDDEKAYKIKFKKKLKMYETSDSKKYYTIRLHCDKHPNRPKVEKKDEDICSFWNDIDLKIKLTDLDSPKRVYSYPDHNPSGNEFPLFVTEEDRTANSLIMKVSFCHEEGQPIEFSWLTEKETGKRYSLIEIEYSFRISTDHWGNYIERHVSFDREKTVVYLQKGNYALPGQSGVRKVSKDQFTDSKVSLATFKNYDEANGYLAYEFYVDEKHLKWDKLSTTNLRVRWDCGSIFQDPNLNDINDDDPGVATKSMGST